MRQSLICYTLAWVVSAAGAAAAAEPHFFYLNKYGDNAWFVDEVAGAKAEAEKLGDKFTSEDLQADANRAITAVDTAIGAGAAGIVIVVPDQKIGPAVLKRAHDANIPMIAVDDGIKDAEGKDAPFGRRVSDPFGVHGSYRQYDRCIKGQARAL